jgi:hypothetical protein
MQPNHCTGSLLHNSVYCYYKGKGKAVLVHTVKTCWGIKILAPLFHNFGVWWRRVVKIKVDRLTPGEEARYSFNKSLDGPQSRSELFRYEKNFFPLPAFEPSSPSQWRSNYTDYTVPVFTLLFFLSLHRASGYHQSFYSPTDALFINLRKL